VGIGIASPQASLDVARGNTDSGYDQGEHAIIIRNNITTANGRMGLRFTSGTGATGLAQIDLLNGATATQGILSFGTRNAAGTIAERMRIAASGEVGIGTTSPSQRLQVSGGNVLIDTSAASTAGQLQLMNPARTFQTNIRAGAQTANITYTLPTAAPTAGQVLTSDASGNMSWATATSTSWGLTGNASTNPSTNYLGTSDAQPLVIRTAAIERVRVVASGNVGIGTNNPLNNLHVSGAAAIGAGYVTYYWQPSAGDKVLQLSTQTAPTTGTGSVITLGGRYGSGNDVTTWASIAGLKENSTNSDGDGYLALFTAKESQAGSFERMRVTSAGNVGIGTTTPGSVLQVNGGAAIGYSASTAAPANGLIVSGATTIGGALTLSTTATGSSSDQVLVIDGSNAVKKITQASLVGSNAWALSGNNLATVTATLGSAPSGPFFGTTTGNTQALQISMNNVVQAIMSSTGVLSLNNDMLVNTLTIGKGKVGTGGASPNNTAIGFRTLESVTTGGDNTAVGYFALQKSTGSGAGGGRNTAVGAYALQQATSGSDNAAVGAGSMAVVTTGNYNTSVGSSALNNLTTGSNNTAMGYGAGQYITSGSNNQTSTNSVYLGYDTRAASNGNDNEIVIGYMARGLGSNTAVLGNTNTTITRLNGNVGIGISAATNSLHIDRGNATASYAQFTAGTTTAQTSSDGSIFGIDASGNTIINQRENLDLIVSTNNTERMRVAAGGDITIGGNVTATAFFESSDARLKDVVLRDGDVVYFRWKDKRDERLHIGYLAQEVKEKLPEQVKTDEQGMMSVNYIEVLVAKLRTLEKRVEELEKKLNGSGDK
jgi:hypothetical protein